MARLEALDMLLLVLLALVVPAGVATATVDRGVGSPVVASVLTLLVGALVFVGVALTGGLSVEYLTAGYRTQLFVHVPVLALAAVAAVGSTMGTSSPSEGTENWLGEVVPGAGSAWQASRPRVERRHLVARPWPA